MTTFAQLEHTQVLFYAFLAAVGLQALYFLFFYIRLGFFKPKSSISSSRPVSIIICARNEEKNLINNLPKILEQDYPEFEVIVVDDCSWDDTQDILKAFQVKHPNFKVVTLQENAHFEGGKKYAVTLGIKAAQYEHIVFTDADCVPASVNWLKSMARTFSEEKQIVLGYGAYQSKNGLLNTLIRFDTFMIAIQYFSYALAGIPYMGVGRNLAYRKELFFKAKGFAKHISLASGDDDLFINQVATRRNTAIVFDAEAHTISSPPVTFKAWVKQKNRHLTTAGRYRFLHKMLLALWAFSYYSFLVLAALLLVFEFPWEQVVSLVLLRYLLQFTVLAMPAKTLFSMGLLIFAPVLELILMLIYPIFAVGKSGISNQRKWKR